MAAPTEPEAIPADVMGVAYQVAGKSIGSRQSLANRIAAAILDDRASRAPVDGAGWRPMETAPKGTALDGLRVDIWLEPIPERQALFANPSTKGRRLVNAWHVKRPDYTGWRNEGSWNGRELNWRATHWMPLPAAPGTHSVAVDGAEAKPVAWRVRERPGSEWTLVRSDPDRDPHFHCWEKQPLYTHPAAASPDAEMVEEAAILERLADRYAEVGQSAADGMANLLRDEARHLRKTGRVGRTEREALSKHEGDQSCAR